MANMEVILLERVMHVGQMGDVVKVKPGFARNFLLPQKKALRATEANKKLFEGRRQELEATNLQRKQEAEAVAEKMKELKERPLRTEGAGSGWVLQDYGDVVLHVMRDEQRQFYDLETLWKTMQPNPDLMG